MSTEKTEAKKRRGTSIPLLVGFIILGVGGYLFGEKIMTYAFYLQEVMIAKDSSKAAEAPDGAQPEMPAVVGGPGLAPKGPAPTRPAPDGDSGAEASADAPSAPASEPPAPNAATPSGNADPETLFAQRDKDGNGKLEGDEISERMQARLTELDSDNDKAVSKDEFLTAWRNRQSSGGTGSAAQRPASASAPAAEVPQPSEPK